MLEGWYCRTMNEEARQQSALEATPDETEQNETQENEQESTGPENESEEDGVASSSIDYKALYSDLKKKVKNLIYENVYFQNNLRASQRRLLKVTHDRSFLLDRLLEYERPELSSSDSENTDSSVDSCKQEPISKKRKTYASSSQSKTTTKPAASQTRRNKKESKKQQQQQQQQDLNQQQQPQPQQLNQPTVEQMLFPHDLLMQDPNQLLFSACDATARYPSTLASITHTQQAPTDLLAPTYSSSLLPNCTQYVAPAQECQLTKEEIERHLQSRQTMPEVVPEGELPSEMFNNNHFNELLDQMVGACTSGMLMDLQG